MICPSAHFVHFWKSDGAKNKSTHAATFPQSSSSSWFLLIMLLKFKFIQILVQMQIQIALQRQIQIVVQRQKLLLQIQIQQLSLVHKHESTNTSLIMLLKPKWQSSLQCSGAAGAKVGACFATRALLVKPLSQLFLSNTNININTNDRYKLQMHIKNTNHKYKYELFSIKWHTNSPALPSYSLCVLCRAGRGNTSWSLVTPSAPLVLLFFLPSPHPQTQHSLPLCVMQGEPPCVMQGEH